ncbi:peptidyl-prolyl cis-trans isomerase [Haloferula sp.]|uniref:peptidylprolyl isomerase n=1 Tax=Haloferula sp. TaxID=2497595 RepID=UPI00329EC0D1
MNRLLRDPLVIFLLIGGGIFLLYAKINPQESAEETDPNRIEINEDVIDFLVSEWSSRWNRPPSPEELKGLLDSHIKEEILFREATKLGLDQSDTIIRRRLAQKMEFLTSDISDLEEVTDESLNAYYEKNAEAYRVEPELGFRHLFFSAEKRKDTATADAEALLAPLNDGSLSFEQAIEKTDQTLLNPEFSTSTITLVGRQFGVEFADALLEAKPGAWIGPVKSGYGVHLVEVLDRKEGYLPELETIREDVLSDYRYDQRETLNKNMLDALLEQYEVVVADYSAEPANSEEP